MWETLDKDSNSKGEMVELVSSTIHEAWEVRGGGQTHRYYNLSQAMDEFWNRVHS